GRARAAGAQREGGRFVARDWDTEVTAALLDAPAGRHIDELVEAIGTTRKTLRQHLRRLVATDKLVSCGAGMYALPASAGHQRPTSTPPAPHQRPVPEPAPAPTSA